MTRSTKTAPYILSECPYCGLMTKPDEHDYFGAPICQSRKRKLRINWPLIAVAVALGVFWAGVIYVIVSVYRHGI